MTVRRPRVASGATGLVGPRDPHGSSPPEHFGPAVEYPHRNASGVKGPVDFNLQVPRNPHRRTVGRAGRPQRRHDARAQCLAGLAAQHCCGAFLSPYWREGCVHGCCPPCCTARRTGKGRGAPAPAHQSSTAPCAWRLGDIGNLRSPPSWGILGGRLRRRRWPAPDFVLRHDYAQHTPERQKYSPPDTPQRDAARGYPARNAKQDGWALHCRPGGVDRGVAGAAERAAERSLADEAR